MRLKFEIVEVANISENQKHEMFRLMEGHYVNVVWNDFVLDLSEKNWIILLFSLDDKMVGFSTQLLIIPEINTPFNNCVVLYSGDTIIAHEYWGSIALPVAFLQLVSTIQKAHPDKNIYWMLISKGLRTYKFLSVFLKEYYPCHFAEIPLFIKNLMQYMGNKKFGENYNSEKGIIDAHANSQFLKETFQPAEKTDNLVANFFYKNNHGYCKGDELLCMAEISDYNLHPFIKRMVKNYG